MLIIKKTATLFLLFAGAAISGCKTPVIISHGISFGHCVGYCNKELLISNQELTYIQRKNGNNPEEKKCIQPLSKEIYNEVLSQFDFKSFYLLDSVIGCPDCADGGAEWIEVKSGSTIKRVTFEYNHAPGQFKVAVEQIRKLAAGMEACKLSKR